jgi:hypothetical protein
LNQRCQHPLIDPLDGTSCIHHDPSSTSGAACVW